MPLLGETMVAIDNGYIESVRAEVETQYLLKPTGCGGSFGEILCHELHTAGLTFVDLAAKWGLPVTIIGELIHDHCKRMEPLVKVNHEWTKEP